MNKLVLATVIVFLSSSAFSKTLVTINGNKIDSKVIDEQVTLIVKNTNGELKDSPELRKEILDRLILRNVINQEARKLKLDQSKEYIKSVKDFKSETDRAGVSKQAGFKEDFESAKEVLLSDHYALYIMEKNPVKEEERKKMYQDFSNFYKGSQEIQVGEIVVETENGAKKVIAELKKQKGKNFKAVATKYTIDPQAKKFGGISPNYINLKDMEVTSPELYKIVSKFKKGQFSETPIVVNGLYSIIIAQDLRKAQLPKYDQIKDGLSSQIKAQRVDEALTKLLKDSNIKYEN